jgi:AcrR family transcriptional regulator
VIDNRNRASSPRGRPRSEQSRQAILAAATDLLREQGLRGMTIDGIAERAGVSKKTIYRWWPSKGVLALDAFYREWVGAQGATPDTGSLEGDLRARTRAAVRLLAHPRLGPTIAALIAEAQTDPQLAQAYHQRVLEPLRGQARAIFERALGRGEIPAESDIEAAIDLLQGALYLRLLHTHAPLNRSFADAIVTIAIHGLTRSR